MKSPRFVFLVSALVLFLISYTATAGAEGEKEIPALPSILFILADDLGSADFITGSSNPQIPTHNIDSLAQLHLTKYYTHNLCTPSRTALLTGRSAWSLGNPFTTMDGGSLSRHYKTLAHELKSRGYKTHMVGKWGIDFPTPSPNATSPPSYININGLGVRDGLTPLNRGFDTFYGLYDYGSDYFTKVVTYENAIDWHRHNQTHQLDYPQIDQEPTVYSTHLFVREAVEILSKWKKEEPTFMQVSFTSPHDPLQVPPEYIAPGTPCSRHQNSRRRIYCGMVHAMDEGIGKMIDTLKKTGMFEHAIIAFTSDNGGAPAVGGFNYPLRGQKATIFQGGIRQQAVIHAPSYLGLKTGKYGNMIHISDWAPTFLGIIDRFNGKEPSHSILGDDIDGIDHSLHLQKNQEDLPPPRTSLVAEFNLILNHTAFIDGDWKLLLGNPGLEARFEEPTGTYYDANNRLYFIMEELVCDLIDSQGTQWFAYTWAYRFMAAFFSDYYSYIFGGNRIGFSDMNKFRYLMNNPYNSTYPITPENLPRAEWHLYHRGNVRLYNLREDPNEDHNVALENKERVEQMVEKVRNLIQNSPPPADGGHHMSVQKQMVTFMTKLMLIGQITLVSFIVLFVLLLRLACGGKKKVQKKKKE